MPIYLRVEEGTTDTIKLEINPLALLLLTNGWKFEIMVVPNGGR